MLTKGFRLIWVKVQVDKNKHFHITFPVSMFVFLELLDSVTDLLDIACFFSSKRTIPVSPSYSIHTIKDMVQMIDSLLDSITDSEPYDLIDVTADQVRIAISIR